MKARGRNGLRGRGGNGLADGGWGWGMEGTGWEYRFYMHKYVTPNRHKIKFPIKNQSCKSPPNHFPTILNHFQ